MRRALLLRFAACGGPVGGDNLYVGDVVHAAWVRVDDAGTEASAATAVETEGSDSAEPYPPYIAADRPFAYFVRDRATGVFLFAGRMDAPAQVEANPE